MCSLENISVAKSEELPASTNMEMSPSIQPERGKTTPGLASQPLVPSEMLADPTEPLKWAIHPWSSKRTIARCSGWFPALAAGVEGGRWFYSTEATANLQELVPKSA